MKMTTDLYDPLSAMLVSCEAIKHDLDHLTVQQLQQVADFIAFLKFCHQRRLLALDPSQLATLATDFAEEDRTLAEAGISDYTQLLHQED